VDLKEIGNIIRKARIEKGNTQAEMACNVGVSERWVRDIEKGKGNPLFLQLQGVLDYLDFKIHITKKDKNEPTSN